MFFLALAVVGVLAFQCLQKRRVTRRESIEPGREAELPTTANTHELPGRSKMGVHDTTMTDEAKTELLTQDNKHELLAAGIAVGAEAMNPLLEEKREMQTQYNKHELLDSKEYPVAAPSTTYSPAFPGVSYQVINPDQLEMASDPVLPELGVEPLKRKPVPPQSPISQLFGATTLDTMLPEASSSETGRTTSPGTATGPSKLSILQQRMECVRAEKERLAKEREPEEMEAALQQEIMTELRKEHRFGGS